MTCLLVNSLSLLTLIRLLHTTFFAFTLCCAHSLACSLTCSRAHGKEVFVHGIECVHFIQIQPIIQALVQPENLVLAGKSATLNRNQGIGQRKWEDSRKAEFQSLPIIPQTTAGLEQLTSLKDLTSSRDAASSRQVTPSSRDAAPRKMVLTPSNPALFTNRKISAPAPASKNVKVKTESSRSMESIHQSVNQSSSAQQQQQRQRASPGGKKPMLPGQRSLDTGRKISAPEKSPEKPGTIFGQKIALKPTKSLGEKAPNFC